jgi:hypothetical protein
VEPTFVGSKEDTTRSLIQEREGRGLRKEHPLEGTFGRVHRTFWRTDGSGRTWENPAMQHPHQRVAHLVVATRW